MNFTDSIRIILRHAVPSRWPLSLPASAVVATFLTLAINSWVSYDMSQDLTVNNEFFTLKSMCKFTTFDYIIVGGGGAGMVVATRLAKPLVYPGFYFWKLGRTVRLNDIPALIVPFRIG
ncbi:Oxygen-dependent choline dehydrogenase [Orchesella cincta]|uniref:Oxygen-dependent choline dehydrogenase n=1 Tax=Orchesella cincta TaxID=48709 RepID=A0A1D2MAU7_ORCCI|nr:Oxygen-dependent choline dehydrogenase [Orchesella cincta]